MSSISNMPKQESFFNTLYQTLADEQIVPRYFKNPKNTKLSFSETAAAIRKSTTVYLQNIPTSYSDNSLYALLSPFGPLETVVMGRNRFDGTGAGFAFAQFRHKSDAVDAVHCLKKQWICGQKLDIEFDVGYEEGREVGKGLHGGRRALEYYHWLEGDQEGYTIVKKDHSSAG